MMRLPTAIDRRRARQLALTLFTVLWFAPPPSTTVIASSQAQAVALRSARGHMTVFLGGPTAILGEEIRVLVTVPAPNEGEPRTGRLNWSVATTGWDEIKKAKEEPVARGADRFASAFRSGGTEEQRVLAPWGAPGRYNLRLFRGNELFDAIEIPVTKGWLDGGVVPSRKIYQVGDSIDFTVTLPANRHYRGHWAGPTVHLFPLELDGKPVPKEKAIEMVTGCLLACGGWLASIAKDQGKRNVHDGGVGIKPGTYTISRATAVDSTKPFEAVRPGRYELRLYDRGPDQALKDYVDLYFAVSDPIVIEPAGATPTELIFARLKVAPLQSSGRGARPTGLGAVSGGRAGTPAAVVHGSRRADFEPLQEVTIGDTFYVVAIFDATPNVVEPAERTITLDWLVNDARQSRTLTLKRKSPGLYVSIPILPALGGGGL